MASIGAPQSAVDAFNKADAQGKIGRLPDVSAGASLGASMPTRSDAVDDDDATETGQDDEGSEFAPLSDLDVVTLPPGMVRLLSTFRPVIGTLNAGLRLATWTAGPHSAPLSALLVLAWWAVCKFAYPLTRYAPQFVLLSAIGWYYLKVHWAPLRSSTHPKHLGDVMGNDRVVIRNGDDDQVNPVDNAASLAATVVQLEELADFAGTVYKRLIRPARRAVDWSDPQATLALASFLVVTYPLYLLCVLPWSQLGIPRVALVFVPQGTGVVGALGLAFRWVRYHIFLLVSLAFVRVVHWIAQYPTGALLVQRASALSAAASHRWSTVAPSIYALGHQGVALGRSVSLRVLYAVSGKDALTVSLVPPYPLFSLDVSTLLAISGTIVLTWCSPLFVLIRHALWSSALVRYITRGAIKAATLGQFGGSEDMKYYSLEDVFFKRTYNAAGPLKTSHSTTVDANLDQRDPFELDESEPPSPVLGPALDEDILSPIVGGQPKIEEFRDVVYQFSIFENQRWWVGLDWTAALLPQERASWTDEQNNATLPPSSFTLPAAKLQLNPVGDGKVYIKRLSRWEWLDQEWTIAGTGYISAMPQYASIIESDANDGASTITGSIASELGGQAAALAGSLSDSLRQRLTATNLLALSTFGAEAPTTNLDTLEVDAEGWQYGGNSWENMGPRPGMGKYTRHRKWVRRAVLVEVVQRGYTPSDTEKAALEKQKQ